MSRGGDPTGGDPTPENQLRQHPAGWGLGMSQEPLWGTVLLSPHASALASSSASWSRGFAILNMGIIQTLPQGGRWFQWDKVQGGCPEGWLRMKWGLGAGRRPSNPGRLVEAGALALSLTACPASHHPPQLFH